MLQIGVVGVNTKTASLRLREKLARQSVETHLEKKQLPFPCVLLSTCNRFEIYFSAANLSETADFIMDILEELIEEGCRVAFYHYFHHTCFYHLAKVISGLDSAILGESDIQRQVKKAYLKAQLLRPLSKEIHYLFQKSLRMGKRLRTDIIQQHKAVNLEKFILHQAIQSRCRSVLFIGNSELNRKIIRVFDQCGFTDITLCTRMEGILPYPTLHFDQVASWVDYSLVIVATKHPEYVIEKQHMKGKTVQTQMIFDLGIPRNVDPSIADGINLIDLERLNTSLEKKRKISAKEIERAEAAIRHWTYTYEHIFVEREINKNRMLIEN